MVPKSTNLNPKIVPKSTISRDSDCFSHECFEQIAKTIVLLEACSARSISVFLWIRFVFHTNASSRLLKPSFCSKHSCFSRDSGQSGEPPVDDLSIYTILLEPPVDDLSIYTRLWEPPLDDLSIYTKLLEPPVDDLSIYTRLLGVGCSAPLPLGSPRTRLGWARLGSARLT